MESPTVAVLIPVLNEARDIRGLLDSIAAQSYPKELIKLIVIDGESHDGSAELFMGEAERRGLDVTLIQNRRRRTSVSLNRGLDAADADIIVRLDARSRVGPHYVARCVRLLTERPDVGVVGGTQIAQPRSADAVGRGIARGLRNQWSTGWAKYRRSSTPGPVDTVWMGVFRRQELEMLGGWSDEVALNEDYELNARYRRAGYLVWFDPTLRSGYLPRPDLRLIAAQHFRFGRVKGLWWVRGASIAPRQVALLAIPPAGALASFLLVRRSGLRTAVPLVLAAAFSIDALGSESSATLAERGVAVATMAVTSLSWSAGVWAGAIGELVGVRHEHS